MKAQSKSTKRKSADLDDGEIGMTQSELENMGWSSNGENSRRSPNNTELTIAIVILVVSFLPLAVMNVFVLQLAVMEIEGCTPGPFCGGRGPAWGIIQIILILFFDFIWIGILIFVIRTIYRRARR